MNMKHTALAISIACGVGVATAQTQTQAQSRPNSQSSMGAQKAAGSAPGMPLTAAQQQSMVKLQQAADRLRESIQALRGKSDTTERAQAIEQAQTALFATYQAMWALPPEIRNAPAAAFSTAEYDASVEKMMRAADALRQSIQAMAKLPAGDARNDAIRQANQALIETHAATAAAYIPSANSKAMGATGTGSGSSPGSGASSTTTK